MKPPLIDAQAVFGCSAAERPDSRTVSELLAHMDRLGIDAAVAGHAAARDWHPRSGNERLLADLAANPAANGRLFPAFYVTPTVGMERGGVAWLRGAMAEHGVRALRFALTRGSWMLRDLYPVMDAIQDLSPVVFLDSRDGSGREEVLAFAARYPGMPVVYGRVMWGGVVGALDVMRNAENVRLDTSWLHSYGTIEWVAREFGVERLIFGTGFRAHQGAAIAGVANAQLPDDDRAAIGGGNVRRLLGLAEVPTVRCAPAADQGTERGLWDRLLAGDNLGMDMIDAHAHLGPSGMWPTDEFELDRQAELALAWMDRLGIRTTIVSGMEPLFTDPVEGGESLERLLAPHGDRFMGYLAFNPFYAGELVPRLDDFFSRPFYVGMKLLCDYWRVPVTDPRFVPAWEYADQHALPILLHTWGGGFDAPGLLAEIAPAYPNASFLLGHSGGSDRAGAVGLAVANPNVYLEWCGSFTTPALWEETFAQVGFDRVVFGTDAIAHDPYWELGRLLSQDVAESDLKPLLGANMRAILARRR